MMIAGCFIVAALLMIALLIGAATWVWQTVAPIIKAQVSKTAG